MEQYELKYFFKVLLPHFDKKLRLPPAFCAKVSQEKSKWATLKSCKGIWKVKVSRDGNGGISFKRDGWPEFVESHSLSIGDFLVFKHLGGFHFKVFVFDPSACEKEFLVESSPRREPPVHSDKPHFAVTMQPHHAKKEAPFEFVRANNLEGKTSASVRNDRGQVWPMRLENSTKGQFRMHMGKGRRVFYKANELKDGDVCVFYLNPNSSGSLTISFDSKIFPSTV